MKRIPGLVALLVAGLPALLPAQYFGQNKVQYQAFDFKIIQTEHFDVYFYDAERPAAMDAARMAERSYARLSRVLNHQYRERKPIILYASHSDFQQTNALGGEEPSEGTGGVTDFARQRMVLPFTGSYEELEHVLQHEMTHQFQYDIWSRGIAGAGLQTIMNVNPPLWFVEGMAEYLSLGPVDANTAMWLRDAALEGHLPTIEQLERDPRVFPYRYGHAILAFIGERWGDEALGAILQSTMGGGGGLDGAFRRTIGISLRQLSDQWRDAVVKRYLPEVADRQRARAFAHEVLNKKNSKGTLHLAPALSPDGKNIAYFSERDFYFVDLWLADATTGEVRRRLLKSSYSSNYETFRFINSAAAYSPDGKLLTISAKRGPRDVILVGDVEHNRLLRQIRIPLDGVSTPSFSADGSQIVFTGYSGGLSDLFIINTDGTGFRRLTDDKYADLHPVWSPDGRTIAFATDRGPDTDFRTLRIGNMRIALYHLDTGRIELLPNMDAGRNSSPQWSPDGKEIAFVSDRTGVSDIFLADLAEGQIYQLTDLYTGVQGITPLSPVLSWAPRADKLAFVYYQNENYDVFVVDNPRSLRRQPFTGAPAAVVARTVPDTTLARPRADSAAADTTAVSLYRTPRGFRAADRPLATGDSAHAAPVSITALLDSATLNLPDSAEFTVRKYRVHFSPDFVAQPTIGYTRDTFGRGFYGGSAISLSDILGNHELFFAGYVNGRISEALVLATYINRTGRLNWAVGASQEPTYFLEPSRVVVDTPTVGTNVFISNVRRLVMRSAFVQVQYPFTRYRRLDAGLRLASVNDAIQSTLEPYDPNTGFLTDNPVFQQTSLGTFNFVEPSIGTTFDNSLMGYTGPFLGRRSRFSVSQALGGWTFTELSGDYRRYQPIVGPITLAFRALYFGRLGRDAERFKVFLGSTDLLRGNTSGSYFRNECANQNNVNTLTGCADLDRLVGTQLLLGSAELRFPILTPQFHFVPRGFPPIEGALFYDIGAAWDEFSSLEFRQRRPTDDPLAIRTPLQTFGLSLRTNVLGFIILRADYSFPQSRRGVGGYWTLSIGPTF